MPTTSHYAMPALLLTRWRLSTMPSFGDNDPRRTHFLPGAPINDVLPVSRIRLPVLLAVGGCRDVGEAFGWNG